MLAIALAVAAGVCLGAGWFFDQIALVYAALALSGGGLALVFVQVWKHRRASKEILRRRGQNGDNSLSEDSDDNPEPEPAADDQPEAKAGQQVGVCIARATGERIGTESTVYVIAGRRRFHVSDCRQITGKDVDELILIEAQEESFTPCSLCIKTKQGEVLARQM